MKPQRPCLLARSALNQYRQRDVVSYLGLRYLLENQAAKTERWASEMSVENLTKRSGAPYYHVRHFKGMSEGGTIEYREIFLPTPQEALAECAIIDAVHERLGNFPHRSVYSYLPPSKDDACGPFARYFPGLKRRQEEIAKACLAYPEGIVQYVDVRKCYPSISIEVAMCAWDRVVCEGGIPEHFAEAGRRILNDYGKISQPEGRGLLTGPVFSHLIANAVLYGIDLEFSAREGIAYLRYVDDMVLIGDADTVSQAVEDLSSRLSSLGLTLHDQDSGKNFRITTKNWLEAKDDFAETLISRKWMESVGGLKRRLVVFPQETETIRKRLQELGFRLPLLDYSGVIQERNFMDRVRVILAFKWLSRSDKVPSLRQIESNFQAMRYFLEQEFSRIVDQVDFTNVWQKKRHLPKLRYVFGRLLFLSDEATLAKCSERLKGLPEMHFHVEMAQVLVSKDIVRILPMGANAAQAAAQLFRSAGINSVEVPQVHEETSMHAMAIFALNGIELVGGPKDPSDFLRFAMHGPKQEDFFHPEPFLSELFSLHGLTEIARHADLLATAFDPSEELTFDAVEQFKGSMS